MYKSMNRYSSGTGPASGAAPCPSRHQPPCAPLLSAAAERTHPAGSRRAARPASAGRERAAAHRRGQRQDAADGAAARQAGCVGRPRPRQWRRARWFPHPFRAERPAHAHALLLRAAEVSAWVAPAAAAAAVAGPAAPARALNAAPAVPLRSQAARARVGSHAPACARPRAAHSRRRPRMGRDVHAQLQHGRFLIRESPRRGVDRPRVCPPKLAPLGQPLCTTAAPAPTLSAGACRSVPPA